MAHLVGLAISLCLTWLLLSGHYTPLLLALGASSVALIVWIAHRMDVIDHEGQPIQLTARTPVYMLWLLKEIMVSNIDVAKRILAPRLNISPRLIKVKAHEQTELGQVIYANSITLTPGTVSVRVIDGTIVVHALTRESAASVESGKMDRRVQRLERPVPKQ